MTVLTGVRGRRFARALLLAAGLIALLPGLALAHPLGNFTVNHFAGIRVERDRIVIDLVIDEAEIPTFQDRLRIDTDGDGVISAGEADAERLAACPRLEPDLALTIDGQRQTLVPFASGLSFPPGTAGLSTMRLVCEFSATPGRPLASAATIGFNDASQAGRIGWHEVVVTGSGMTLATGGLPATSVSNRLRTYPANLIAHPLNVRNVTFSASPGGPVTPDVQPDDAFSLSPLPSPGSETSPKTSAGASAPPSAAAIAIPTEGPPAAAVPGGVVGLDIAGLIGTSALTPLVLLTSLAAAFLLGAGHALTPGHGKTLMGAYLVGSRGQALHAIVLGLAVAVSHTLGIVVLAAIILQARNVAPELFNTLAPIVSGLTVIAIGAWLLTGQVRLRRAGRHAQPDELGHGPAGHDHDHDQEQTQAPADAPVGWRSLFALGLAGGLIPSTNALIILLAAINVDRPAYGLVLVVAFGLGMAAVLVGIGLVLVLARQRLDRWLSASRLGRLGGYAPLGAACLILVLGIWLTGQAIGVGPTF